MHIKLVRTYIEAQHTFIDVYKAISMSTSIAMPSSSHAGDVTLTVLATPQGLFTLYNGNCWLATVSGTRPRLRERSWNCQPVSILTEGFNSSS